MNFAISVIIASFVAFLIPDIFISSKGMIIPLLLIIMTSMALTLSLNDFVRAFYNIKPVLIGVLLQFTIMPLLAFGLAILFELPNEYILGMVLVGSVAGGTASNVMCFLSGGNVALSITITAISTVLSVVLTPMLLELYVGSSTINIPVYSMMLGLVKLVLIPVALGIFIRHIFKNNNFVINAINSSVTIISQLAIILIIAIVVSLSSDKILTVPFSLFVAVVLHNLFGLVIGYMASYTLTKDKIIARTIAIEVGMQNSGLALSLAMKYFTVLSALPAVLFSIIHNISGSIYAGVIRNKNN